jgi:nitrogen fixation protein FixH
MTDSRETPGTQESEARHAFIWVGLIFAFLGGQVLLMLVMVYLATSDQSFAVEPDYYQKGLNWDAQAAQLRYNEQLGWTVEIRVGEPFGVFGERTVTCTLKDASGVPIDDAVVQLVAFPHARGSDRSTATLEAVGSGEFTTNLRMRGNGLWEFRLVARRTPDTFTHTEIRDLQRPGGS